MGARSQLLREIEDALRSQSIRVNLKSVEELRSYFPSYSHSPGLNGLEDMLRAVKAATPEEIKQWRKPVKKREVKRSQLPHDVIRDLSSKGVPVTAIAEAADISRARVYKILKDAKEGRN